MVEVLKALKSNCWHPPLSSSCPGWCRGHSQITGCTPDPGCQPVPWPEHVCSPTPGLQSGGGSIPWSLQPDPFSLKPTLGLTRELLCDPPPPSPSLLPWNMPRQTWLDSATSFWVSGKTPKSLLLKIIYPTVLLENLPLISCFLQRMTWNTPVKMLV